MKWSILSVTLFFVGLILLLGHIDAETGITTLNMRHSREALISDTIEPTNKTLISGEFRASQQNLNKISFQLYIPNEFKQGQITFRLRKNGQEEWHYETKLMVGTLTKKETAIFSFIPISDSEGNTYRFEVGYEGSNAGGRIVVKSGNQAFTSSYDFFRARNFTSELLADFSVLKLPEAIEIPGILVYSILAFFPFIVSLFSITKSWQGLIAILTCIFIFEDLTTTHLDLDIAVTAVALVWIIMIFDGLSYEVPALISLVPLSLLVVLDMFKSPKMIEAATWTYTFLFISVIDFIFMATVKKSERIGLIQILRHLMKTEYERVIFLLRKVPPLVYKTVAIVLIGKLLWSGATSVNDTIKWYLSFFPRYQYKVFFARTGWILAVIYLLSLPVFVHFVRNSKYKLLVTLIALFVVWKGQNLVIDGTTSIKDDVLIMDVKPNETREPWVDVTIVGRNFNDLPFSGTVLVAGENQRIIKWTDREIIFRTDPSSTNTGKLSVERIDSKESNSVHFVYKGNR
jgi:hypothetical protein